MLQRKSVAVGYCLNRAAEVGHLAALAIDPDSKARYLQLVQAWLRLAQNAEFTDKLETHLSGEKQRPGF